MAETAAHLVDHVFPMVPVRQWVLSIPFALRYRLAYDSGLLSDTLNIFIRVVFGELRRRARDLLGLKSSQCGAVTFVQRWGDVESRATLSHLVLDGVYAADAMLLLAPFILCECTLAAASTPTQPMSSTSEATSASHLLREIRKWDLVALVLNSIVGAGIFGLPARAYALAGPYSLLAYLVCAVPVLLIVLCFAEVSSRFKETGGLYLYARAAFGPLVGFEIGWLAWFARLTGFAALCNLFVDYLSYFLPASGIGPGRVAAIAVVVSFLAAANVAGVRLASLFGNVFTVGKLVPLVLLVAAGSFFINTESYSSTVPPSYIAFSASVLLLVFAFTGFEMACFPAGEARDPRRHLLFALLTGTVIAVLLYVGIQAVCIATVPDLANSPRPLADAGGYLLGRLGAAISVGALISIMGTMNANMLTVPRLLFAMAEQGQLPRIVATTHRRFHTPHVAILFSAVVMLVLTLTGTFASAATLSTIIRLTTYAVTCAALPTLRRKSGSGGALFVVPAGEIVSMVALILIVWLLSSSSWPEAYQTLLAGAFGLLLYAVFARRERRTPI